MQEISNSAHCRPPIAAIVGRPNVGKSTLFNRIVGFRQAVVSEQRGTTRDRLYGNAEWNGRAFTLIDAGGYDETVTDALGMKVQEHLSKAWDEADAVILVLDLRDGVLQEDLTLLARLRKSGKPIVAAINKCDSKMEVPPDFYRLGFDRLLTISAMHGLGLGDLLDNLLSLFPPEIGIRPSEMPMPSVAILGRPNVGKSSIFNALLNEERVIVSDVPGTTRDSIDTKLTLHGQPLRLIDTAGLRQRRKIKSPIDLFSMFRTEKAVIRADVALVVLDATQPSVTRDDHRIINRVIDERRGCVIALNKWDLVESSNQRELVRKIRQDLPYALFAPILVTSAQTGFGVYRALEKALRVCRAMHSKLEIGVVKAILQEAWERQAPPRYRGRALLLNKVRWIEEEPLLELTTSPVGKVPASYQQFLLKQLREIPDLDGVPLGLSVVSPEEHTKRLDKRRKLKQLRAHRKEGA